MQSQPATLPVNRASDLYYLYKGGGFGLRIDYPRLAPAIVVLGALILLLWHFVRKGKR